MNKIQNKVFIHEKFSEYYRLNSSIINPPSSLVNREFAFFLFKDKFMLRHKKFENTEEFKNMIKILVPSDVYYSSAYYESPEEVMEAKGWFGADLIFDIDADHISNPCQKQHDMWICNNCGATGRGVRPEKCPSCRGQKLKERSWPCELCIESAKKEAIKLIDFLVNDFGLSHKEMTLSFSGHRGYHVNVEEEVVQILDQVARKEIVDYIVGSGLEPEFHGFEMKVDRGPNLKDAGWRGRIAGGVYDFLLNANEEKLGKMAIKRSKIANLINQRERILKSWKSKGLWRTNKLNPKSWKKIVCNAIENQSVKIDTVVTTDIHRLIRLANTLHGKTGLKKVFVPIDEVELFDPLKGALAFDEGDVKLVVSEAPEFRLGEERYGPYKNEKVELPTAAGLFLLCKGAAQVNGDN